MARKWKRTAAEMNRAYVTTWANFGNPDGKCLYSVSQLSESREVEIRTWNKWAVGGTA